MRKNVTVYVMPNHQQDAKSFCWQTVSTCVRLDISVGDIAVSLRSRVFHDSHNPFSVPTCIGQLKIDSYSFLPFSYFLNLSPSLSRVTLSSRTWSQPPFTFCFSQTSFRIAIQSASAYQTTVLPVMYRSLLHQLAVCLLVFYFYLWRWVEI